MKKVIVAIMFLIFLISFISCSTEEDKGTAPLLSSIYITDIYYNVIDTVSIGDFIYVFFTITDPDLDADYVEEWYYLNNSYQFSGQVPLAPMLQNPTTYYTTIEIFGPTGSWRVDIEAFDAKDNRSGIDSALFTVVL